RPGPRPARRGEGRGCRLGGPARLGVALPLAPVPRRPADAPPRGVRPECRRQPRRHPAGLRRVAGGGALGRGQRAATPPAPPAPLPDAGGSGPRGAGPPAPPFDAPVTVGAAQGGKVVPTPAKRARPLPDEAVAFSPDGRLLPLAGTARAVKVWELATARRVL